MIEAVSSESAKANCQLRHARTSGFALWSTAYIGRANDSGTHQLDDRPQAFLDEISPNSTISPHFHQVDQFSVFVSGAGTIGRNPAPAVTLHYVDHHTAYGPITSGPFGLSIFVIRVKTDPGGIHLHQPGYQNFLRPTKKRYLISDNIGLSIDAVLRSRNSVALDCVLPEADGGDGLGAFMLRMGGNMKTAGPDPTATGGQYYLVLNGSLRINGQRLPKCSIVYVSPDEKPFEVCADSDGLEALVVNFQREQ